MSRIARRVRRPGVYFVTSETWQRRALFGRQDVARVVLEQVLECRERGFYKLHAFVIMPNHLHLLLTPAEHETVQKAMQMIKGGSAHRVGQEFPMKFPVWQSGFHDRWVRDAAEYGRFKHYIEQNVVEARLAGKPEDYVFGSASGGYRIDRSRFDESDFRG